jgi:hypothetical protein
MLSIRQVYEEASLRDSVLIPIEERTFDYCVAFVFQDYNALEPLAREFIRFVAASVPAPDAPDAS